MQSMKKRIAFSIAIFILSDVDENSHESPESMYMRWKKKKNIVLHDPENAYYALRKFIELGHLSEAERTSLAETVRCEAEYLKKEAYI